MALEDLKAYLAKMVESVDGISKEDTKTLLHDAAKALESWEDSRQQQLQEKQLAKGERGKKEAEKNAEKKKAHLDAIPIHGSGPAGAPKRYNRL